MKVKVKKLLVKSGLYLHESDEIKIKNINEIIDLGINRKRENGGEFLDSIFILQSPFGSENIKFNFFPLNPYLNTFHIYKQEDSNDDYVVFKINNVSECKIIPIEDNKFILSDINETKYLKHKRELKLRFSGVLHILKWFIVGMNQLILMKVINLKLKKKFIINLIIMKKLL